MKQLRSTFMFFPVFLEAGIKITKKRSGNVRMSCFVDLRRFVELRVLVWSGFVP